MSPITITCASCGHRWEVANAFSVYEQQAVESCPCPDCGAYTLCCGDALAGPGGEQPNDSLPVVADAAPEAALPFRGL